jgi:hypothetical protein
VFVFTYGYLESTMVQVVQYGYSLLYNSYVVYLGYTVAAGSAYRNAVVHSLDRFLP